MAQRFSAIIGKVGVNPYVEVPPDVSAALGGGGYIPVSAELNGRTFRAGLVPRGEGRHRLFINGQMRAATGVDVGDVVQIELAVDREPRTRPVPAQLESALSASPEASAAWGALSASRRNEILDYLNSLKRTESVERNVGKVVGLLIGGQAAHHR